MPAFSYHDHLIHLTQRHDGMWEWALSPIDHHQLGIPIYGYPTKTGRARQKWRARADAKFFARRLARAAD